MSGGHEVDAAPAGDADPPVDAAAATPAAHAEAPTTPSPPPRAAPPSVAERVRPAHVVPGPSGAAAGEGVPAFVAAMHARDAAAARASISPAFQGKANGRPLDGEAQVRLLESFWAGFPDGNFSMDPTGGSGRYVITWTFQGTHGGIYLGVPPTGTPVAFSGFIIAVADRSGVTSLDWKWDTKVFTRAVLGPDEVGDLEVKDTFRDPSKRWQHDGRGPGRGPGQGQRKKGKGRPGQPQAGRTSAPSEGLAEGQPDGAAEGQPQRQRGQPGPPGLPGQGKRRRRGKGPRTDQPATPDQPAAAQAPEAPGPAPSEPTESPDGT